MTNLKITQGHQHYSTGHISLVVHSNISILHHFRHITTFTVYMTMWDWQT